MTDQIQTRPDGSIDISHYMDRAHQLRSQQAHDLAGQAARRVAAGAMTAIVLVGFAAWALIPALS